MIHRRRGRVRLVFIIPLLLVPALRVGCEPREILIPEHWKNARVRIGRVHSEGAILFGDPGLKGTFVEVATPAGRTFSIPEGESAWLSLSRDDQPCGAALGAMPGDAVSVLEFHAFTPADLDFLGGMNSLRSLKLSNADSGGLHQLAGLSGIEHLKLHVSVDSVESDWAFIRSMKALRVLELDGRVDEAILSQLHELEHLESIRLSQVRTEESALLHLGRIQSLRRLDTGRIRVSSLDPLRGLTGLKSLTVDIPYNARIEDLGCLREFRELESLTIRGSGGTYADMTALMRLLTGLPNLKSLSLGVRDGETLEVIGTMTRLETLAIGSDRELTCEDVRPLTRLKSLQTLILTGLRPKSDVLAFLGSELPETPMICHQWIAGDIPRLKQ